MKKGDFVKINEGAYAGEMGLVIAVNEEKIVNILMKDYYVIITPKKAIKQVVENNFGKP